MLTDLRRCSPDEVARQASYLAATPVSVLAEALLSGQARLSKASVRSLHDLGTLETIFGSVGTAQPPPDQARFRVKDVMQALESNHADPKMLSDIKGIMASDAHGAVESNITVLRSSSGLLLVDGNKRSIAFFARRRGIEAPIDVSVWVVEGIEFGA